MHARRGGLGHPRLIGQYVYPTIIMASAALSAALALESLRHMRTPAA